MAMVLAERVARPPALLGLGPARPAWAAPGIARERDGDLGGGLTLDDAIVGTWEGLAARVVMACPLCAGPLRPHATPDVVGGCCDDCGASLS
jgi:hypothetical protein